MLESRGRRVEGGTKRTTSQALTLIQKVPETVIHLKLDEEQLVALSPASVNIYRGRVILEVLEIFNTC